MASEHQFEDDFDGTAFTAKAQAAARKEVEGKKDPERLEPVVAAASEEVKTDDPAEKSLDGYDQHADNDGNFHIEPLDDGTNVEEGVIMENQARAPAHQQHELAVEDDAPGFEQSAALMLPRGNPHYDEGGSVAEVAAGRSFGEA
jgi:hypothetical protein